MAVKRNLQSKRMIEDSNQISIAEENNEIASANSRYDCWSTAAILALMEQLLEEVTTDVHTVLAPIILDRLFNIWSVAGTRFLNKAFSFPF